MVDVELSGVERLYYQSCEIRECILVESGIGQLDMIINQEMNIGLFVTIPTLLLLHCDVAGDSGPSVP